MKKINSFIFVICRCWKSVRKNPFVTTAVFLFVNNQNNREKFLNSKFDWVSLCILDHDLNFIVIPEKYKNQSRCKKKNKEETQFDQTMIGNGTAKGPPHQTSTDCGLVLYSHPYSFYSQKVSTSFTIPMNWLSVEYMVKSTKSLLLEHCGIIWSKLGISKKMDLRWRIWNFEGKIGSNS